ncbi:hypothetical protein [Nocardia donostiensis]|uniref:Uncharacterized protein n=1 Tax=Nocardia donostiensis TaxID=1538463 RepID=A0A1W0B5S8_9NOCA|nr:hypothetical protein [Nocardia donostiensis]ONM47482.1 hypothetical protein B0T46_18180 [Nocardia donostiensis]OQS14289.1 hypothetical protein B0T36_14865 [Nocardia donostiensis]OQS17883.1 hypothetical protein B0T44_22660 [Nocardia donostiensis]
MEPQVIEIVQSSPAWWQVWLPLLGSLLVAGAAVVAVLVNNRTNRQAISAADARSQQALEAAQQQTADTARRQIDVAQRQVESVHAAGEGRAHEQWRQDKVAAVVADSLVMSGRIYQALRRDTEWTDELIGDLIRDLEDGSERANVLRIVSSDIHYKQWRRLADSLSDALLSAVALQRKKLKEDAPEDVQAAREHKAAMLTEVKAAERALISETRAELGILPD